MENELTINGVTYIRKDSVKKDEYKELKENINQRLTLVNKEINKMLDTYINDEDVTSILAESIKIDADEVSELSLYPSSQQLYKSVDIDEHGNITVGGHKARFTMTHVKTLKQKLHDKVLNNNDLKTLSETLGVTLPFVHRLIYNIMKGTFEKAKTSPSRGAYAKGSDTFKPYASSHSPYVITSMSEDGSLYAYKHGKIIVNIHQVIQIKLRVVDKTVTVDRAKQVASDIGIPYDTFNRIVYNIQIGTFNEYMAEWRNRINETPISKMPIKTQNNPEKRREQGYYGGVGGY